MPAAYVGGLSRPTRGPRPRCPPRPRHIHISWCLRDDRMWCQFPPQAKTWAIFSCPSGAALETGTEVRELMSALPASPARSGDREMDVAMELVPGKGPAARPEYSPGLGRGRVRMCLRYPPKQRARARHEPHQRPRSPGLVMTPPTPRPLLDVATARAPSKHVRKCSRSAYHPPPPSASRPGILWMCLLTAFAPLRPWM